jgi:flavorubredoxin
MDTHVDEIADGIFRLSTLVPDIGPDGFTFNQFVVRGTEESLLFHTGPRGMFPSVSAAVANVTPLDRLRWITFGHYEADECGAMNDFLAVAPNAQVVHGGLAVMVSLNDLADRPPRAMGDDEVLDIGGHRMRFLPTPHVPHNWESGLWFDETTETLFAGDLFTHIGKTLAVTSDDIVEPALAGEEMFHSTSLGPNVAPTIRRLAALKPTTLATMHGASYRGNGAQQLEELARGYATIVVDEAA